jgi:hypothetical protein
VPTAPDDDPLVCFSASPCPASSKRADTPMKEASPVEEDKLVLDPALDLPLGAWEMVLFTCKAIPDRAQLDKVFQEVLSSVPASQLEGVNTKTYCTVVVGYDETPGFHPQRSLREVYPKSGPKVFLSIFSFIVTLLISLLLIRTLRCWTMKT